MQHQEDIGEEIILALQQLNQILENLTRRCKDEKESSDSSIPR